jgi:hypothetical protein
LVKPRIACFQTVGSTVTVTAASTPTPTANPSATPVGGCTKYVTGDADCNGTINIFDFNVIVTNYAKTVTPFTNGDFDGNGVLNIFDFNILVTNYGK